MNSTFYLYSLVAARQILKSGGQGSTFTELSSADLGDFRLPLPPPPLQDDIASFLDRETAKIDKLIDKKRRLLELLEEKRTALITRAVTRGLDPDVPMKDSGVEWIGDIPEHWEVVPIGRLARGFRAGKTPPTSNSEYYRDGTIPWFGPSSLGTTLTVEKPSKLINAIAIEDGSAPIEPAGTVLLQTIAEIGRIGVLEGAGSFNQQLTALTVRPQLLQPYHLAYYIYAYQGVLRSWASATTLPIISGGDLKEFPVVVPPVAEQKAIVEALRAQDRRQEKAKLKIERAIDLVQEYRTAVISAAVMGKLQAREQMPA